MVRKCVTLCLLLGLFLCLYQPEAVHAESMRVKLTFNGTTATCFGSVSPSGSIEITLELWQGNTKLVSWSGSGTGYVQISETYTVSHNVTYTLKLNGTVNGVAFTEASVTETCP